MTSAVGSPVFFAGGGEMGERIRNFDWSQTPIGPISDWPQSLKTAVRLLLNSRYPMFIWWGPELTNIYNDAYIPVLGARHPQALGQSAPKIWADIWPIVGPQSEMVLNQGEATWNESVLLIMERYGYSEETYFTFSYSPVPNETGDVEGLFCVCTEDTQRIFGERQLALLRDLAAKATDARTWQDACIRSATALTSDPQDLLFAMIYIAEPDGVSLSLAGTSGIAPNHVAAPPVVKLAEQTPWPFAALMSSNGIIVVEDLHTRIDGSLPTGVWQESPSRAALVPIAATGQTGRGGVLVVGLNPFRFFDEDYRDFLLLVAGQISASIASAQAYEEESRRAEALAELDTAKTAFFSNVSHEFRTPLTLMLGPVEDMLEKSEANLTPEARDQLEVVHRNSLRLLKLVNTMLDFSRIEAGRLRANYEPVDLAQYTAELASVFRAAIERGGLRLTVDCPPLPEPVYIDVDMWEKIVLNLLSNALKFTSKGEIRVQVTATEGHAQLIVSDTGVGIPAEEMPHIFERFHQVKVSSGRTYEGTGIGLALVQELVKLHGGTVAAESHLNEGSRFIVTVPLGQAHLDPAHLSIESDLVPPTRETEAFVQEALRWLPDPESVAEPLWLEEDRKSAGSSSLPPVIGETHEPRPRIVWADDNIDMRDYVSRLLRERFDVDAVADGQAALEAVRANPPDLVLADIMMPRLDGIGLLRALRNDRQLRHIPIILLSARAGEEAQIEGIETGADDYLIKPFSARELMARVSSHVKMARARREATEALRTSESQHRKLSIRLKALLEATSRLIETLETKELLTSLLDLSHEIVAADALGVWRMNDKGDWSIVASSGLSDEFIQETFSRLLNIPPPEETVVVQPPELADRSTPLLRHRWEQYDREGIRSLMIMPLLLHGNVSGTLVFYCHTPHVFTEIEIESAQALANIAAAAITTAELYETQSRLRYVAEEAAIRESFLASAGAILSESLDYEQTLTNVARAAVPDFADWCAVDLLDETGELQRLAVIHVNPEKVTLAQELFERYPPDPNAEGGVRYVIRTGEPELMREIPDDLIVQVARDEHHLRLIRELQLTSYICVPLQAGGTVYGTMTFVSAESKQSFDDQDLNTAQEIARRAAQAIDNARLYRNLREGEQRLRLALTAARAGVWELDITDGSYHWSHELLSLYGYDAVTPRTYERWISSLHPDDRQRVEEDFGRRLDSDEIDFQQEFRIIHPERGLHWILDVGHIERDEDGRAIRCIGINIDITERKEAEEKLRRLAEESQILLDTLPIGVFFAHDPAAHRITGNRAAYELLRQPMYTNLSKTAATRERPTHFRVYQHGEELAAEQLPTQRAARGEQIRNEEVMHVFEDGIALNILVSAAPLYDSEGHPRGAITSLQDITERTQAERELRKSEERFREIFETAGVSVFVEDFSEVKQALDELRTQGVHDFRAYFSDHSKFVKRAIDLVRVVDVNQEAIELFSAESKSELLGSLTNIFLPETEDIFIEELVALAEGHDSVKGEVQLRTLDGRSLVVLFTVHFGLESRNYSRVVVTLTDITQRYQAEMALREREERYELVVTGSEAAIWDWDVQARRVIFSPRWKELRGLADDEVGDHEEEWSSRIHPEDLERVMAAVQAHFEGQTPVFSEEYRILHQDGEWRWIHDRGIARHDSMGRVIRMAGSETDITERKQAEAALKAKEAELALVAKAIPLALTRCSRDLRYLFANRAAAEFLDLTPDQLIGKPIVEVMGEKAFAIIKPYIEQVLQGEPVEFEAHIPYSTGRSRWVRVNYMPDYDEQGNVVGWVASIVDITSRKQAEEALRQLNETLEERVQERTQQVRDLVAQLTMAEQEERRRISQILHDDLQQLLSAIKMKLSMLYQDLKNIEQSELETALEEGIAWIEEATKATRLLTVDLTPPILQNQALLHAIQWLQNQMKELHGLEVTIEAEHDWYIQDEDLRVLLFQIIRELLFNVKKHAGVDKAVLQLKEGAGCLVIHVIDEGQGFNVEEATAQNEHATGFGLFSVRGRLHPLGGRLEILSQPGAGTHIVVYTPIQSKTLRISRLPKRIIKKPIERT